MTSEVSHPSALRRPFGLPEQGAGADRIVFWFFVVQVVAGTFLQKFGYFVPVTLPILLASIGLLATLGIVRINVLRLGLYAVFAACAAVSQMLSGAVFSSASVLLFMVIYAPIVVEYDVSEETYRKCMRFFVAVMIIFSAIVCVQQVVQFTIGARYWPDLDALSRTIVYPGYQYWRETAYNSGVFMPNGVFFLEPSIIGQFLVLGFVAEMVFFKRPLVILALAIGAGLTMSGTAAVVLLFAAPFIVLRSPPKIIAILAVGAVLLLALAVSLGVAESLLSRTAEFSQAGTSGYARFVGPFVKLSAQLAHQSSLYTGLGAGNATIDHRDFDLPFTKLIIEYGLLTAVAFYALFFTSIFGGGRSVRMGMALFAFHAFGGGGLIVPVYAITIIVLGAVMVPPNSMLPESDGVPPRASRRKIWLRNPRTSASQDGAAR